MHAQQSVAEDEYEALWSGCGLIELAGWSSVSVTGADRQSFLNNFCTNDVKRLAPDESCEAFITNVKGKVVGHGVIACRADELVIVTAPGQAERIIDHLDRYVIRKDVQLRDTTAERAFLLVAGAQERCAHVLARRDGITEWFPTKSWFTRLLESTREDFSEVKASLKANGGVICGSQAFEVRRIEAGLPLYGVDFSDANLPQEIGRDAQAISFTKGCYLGQETVARIDAIGHVNQRIVGVRFLGDKSPQIGAELSRAGSKVGHVTSAAFSARLGAPLGLAMVRRESNSPGSKLESAFGECEIVSLPYGS